MTGYGDVGEEVIGRLASRLGCAPHQVTLWQRGLTWPWSLCAGEVIRHMADSAARRATWLRLPGASIVPAEWPEGIPGRVRPFRRSS